jgi:hypothetical protein
MQAAGLIDAWARQELAEHTPAAGAIHLVGIDGVFAADGSRIGRIDGAVGRQDREIEIEEQRSIGVGLLGMLVPVSSGKDEVCDPGDKNGGQAKRGQPLAGTRGALGLVVRAGGDIDGIVKEDRQLDSAAIGEPFTILIQQIKERGDVI